MKYIITESQYKLISELDRHWMDLEYLEQYEKLKNKVIPHFEKLIDGYSRNKSHITLYDSDDAPIMRYNKKSGELFYDRSLDNTYNEILPHPFWMVNGKYIMAEVFENIIKGYEVKGVQSAHIS